MKKTCLPLVLSFCLSAGGARAEVVYDNSSHPEETFNNTLLESADQITVEGDARLLTEFAFEYFGGFVATGDETARLRFYYIDGLEQNGLNSPGTLFYDSGPFNIASGYRTVRARQLDLLLEADTFTWSVQFAGLGESEQAGLLNYDPPTVGGSGDFFWQKRDDIWQAVASDDTGNNFAARLIAELVLRIRTIQRQGAAASVVATVKPGKAYGLEFTRSLGSPDSDILTSARIKVNPLGGR
jgi:hypothetical protein